MRLLSRESQILQRTMSVNKFVQRTNDDFSQNSLDSRKGCLIIWKLAPPNLIPGPQGSPRHRKILFWNNTLNKKPSQNWEPRRDSAGSLI